MSYERLMIKRAEVLARIKVIEERLKHEEDIAEQKKDRKLLRNLNDRLTKIDEEAEEIINER